MRGIERVDRRSTSLTGGSRASRRTRRILAGVILAAMPSALVLVACEDITHLPGLANELPNYIGNASGVVGTSTASSSGSTTSSTSTSTSSSGAGGSTPDADAGPAQSVCDTAAALSAGLAGCSTCESTSCEQAYVACMQAPANECTGAVECVANCGGSADAGTCIGTCITVAPAYLTFIECVYGSCASECGVSPPLTCPVDAGTD